MTNPAVDRASFVERYPFPPDAFQLDAFDALDRDEHVVVAVPTGSGKTVVAEYGIDRAVAAGRRAFYTAPIKALSNQKYRDLLEHYGPDDVGLLTGDNSINGDAPIVVMTTEVLRNMIYGRHRRLHDLGVVVLDEVHFLQDSYRGPVWEEVMIHLPQHVRLVCLSATVSNADELAEWITTVRGPTSTVVEQRRPVELRNHYLVADRTADRLRLLPMFVDGRVNRDALTLDESAVRRGRAAGGPRRGADRRRGGSRPGAGGEGRKVLAPPGRVETVELLAGRDLLPAIYFIFSRAQCDDAAAACVRAGLGLTSHAEQQAIDVILAERLGNLDEADLDVLGVTGFAEQLRAGVAAHHAGMVPPMKEAVEACFVEGLIKVVFATETLAVGINMPARSVVIEKLTKFTGEHHERLTPGQYTQLTGRAGRRGIDETGTAVVHWSPWVRFDEVAELASSSTFHLRSAFHPTYNMAANLIRTYSSDEAHRLLNLSFAQFQADRDVVRLEARLERRRRALAELREEATSDFGDLDEYRRLRDDDRHQHRAGSEIADGLAQLKPGVVIHVDTGSYQGPAAVVASTHRKGALRVTVVTRSGKLVHVGADDFAAPPRRVGNVTLPKVYAPNRKDYRMTVGRMMRRMKSNGPARTRRDLDRADRHPVARDPELRRKLAAAGHADRVQREIEGLERRIGGKNQSLAQDFDRVLDVLEAYDYIDADAWELTESGEVLARIFHESDLLVAEVVRHGVIDGLSAPALAALVSTLVYEHRSADPPPSPWFADDDARRRWRRIQAISDDLQASERRVGLEPHRPPDPTFGALAYAWVAGEGFADVVGDEDVTGGDFVRTTKQLIDLLRQLAIVAPDADTRRVADDAAAAAFRGVVADSSAPSTESSSHESVVP